MSILVRLAVQVALFGASSVALAAWEPEKPVEFVVPARAGSRIDQMAQLMQGIIIKHKLMKQDLVVVHKSGGAGAEAFFLLKNGQTYPSKFVHSDDKVEPHRIMIVGNSLFTVPLATGVPFNWKDLSPVATLAFEPFILWTHSQDGYKSAGEYIAAARAAGPGKMRMRGTGSKQEDQFVTVAIEHATGVKFTYKPSKHPPDGLLVQEFDSALYKPMEIEALWYGGSMTPQCVFNNARLSAALKMSRARSWNDIPTCKEAGINVSYQALVSIFMGPGVTDEQMGYFISLFKKVVETPEWKAYMEEGAYSQTFMTSQKLAVCLAGIDEFHKQQLNGNCGFICKQEERREPPLSMPCI